MILYGDSTNTGYKWTLFSENVQVIIRGNPFFSLNYNIVVRLHSNTLPKEQREKYHQCPKCQLRVFFPREVLVC